MEIDFEQLATTLTISSSLSDILRHITCILKENINDCLPSFVNRYYSSILIVEHWTWSLLTSQFCQWIHQTCYTEFLHTFTSFNKEIIFYCDNIDDDTKSLLLIPETIDQINQIIEQIDRTTNDGYIDIVSHWLENLSFLIQQYPHLSQSIVVIELNQYFEKYLLKNHQLNTVILQLQQSSSSLLSSKEIFYMKTNLFLMSIYFHTKPIHFLSTATEILHQIGDEYRQMIQTYSHTVATWHRDTLICLTYLIRFISDCTWWGRKNKELFKILFSTEHILCEYIQALVRILDHTVFHKQIQSRRSNYETILLDSILFTLQNIVQTRDINWYFRSMTRLTDILLKIAELSMHYRISLCIYSIYAEILSDEKFKALKFTDTMSSLFFQMLQDAYHNPSKKFKQISFSHLLKYFLFLSKNDSIQQKTADLNEVPFLIQISDEYPMVFDILWALSFNHDIQQQLRSNESFITKLTHLANECHNEQMKKIAHGLLWNLQYRHQHCSMSTNTEQKTFDIMISYSHKDRELCKQLYHELIEAGYRIWIDFDQMHGNVMDSMAQAIESSPTVVICMSEEYRKSNYCRAEAHYAFQRQRKIVPVLLEKYYKPDGWLLFLVGQLLYVDFTKYEFSRAMEMLHKELSIKNDISELTGTIPTRSISVQPRPKHIQDWSITDVQQWLTEQNLEQMLRLLKNCNGRSLIYLHQYITNGNADEIFLLLKEEAHRQLGENLSLIELSCFRSLMDEQQSRFVTD